MPGDVLLIGIGNPIRGDDGVGWHIARSLETILKSLIPGTKILIVQQLTMDLVEEISSAGLVVFIDAEIGDPPGQIKQREILAGTSLSGPGSHFFDPPTLLAAVQALYGTHPRALLFSLSSNAFDYGEELSQPIQQALTGLTDQIREAIMAARLDVLAPEF